MSKGDNIFHRKDGRWEARYIKGRSSQNRIIYGYVYGKTHREAKFKREQKMFELSSQSAGKKKPDQKSSLIALCKEYLNLRRMQVKPSTYAKYESYMRLYLEPYFSGSDHLPLTTLEIAEFCGWLQQEKKLSETSVSQILRFFKAAYGYAQKQDPALGQIDFIFPKSESKEVRFLSREEQRKLTDHCSSRNDSCCFAVLLMLQTGLRLGELCALTWRQVDLETNTLTVSKSLSRSLSSDSGHSSLQLTSPKSRKSARTIPIGIKAQILLKEHYCSNPSSYVLTGSDQCMNPRTLQYQFGKITQMLELEGVTLHTLRHTFATRCVEAGVDMKSLSEILGHSNVTITLEKYVHSSMQSKREQIRKLDEFQL